MKDTNKKGGIFKRMRTRIIALLGALGVAVVGGNALLNKGSENVQQENKTKIESTNTGKTSEDTFKEEIKFDTKIVDEILAEYNSNLPEEEKITKDDLGIILQENMGDGHVIKDVAEDGEVSYIENHYKGWTGIEEGQEWIDGEDVDSILALFDKKSKKTIAGICEIDGRYHGIKVERLIVGDIEYIIDDHYVGIPKVEDPKVIYENFENYYKQRRDKLEEQKNPKNIGETEKTDEAREY